MWLQDDHGQQLELFSVYVPTNHVYVGDIFLMGKVDIIKPNLSVREGLGECPLSLTGIDQLDQLVLVWPASCHMLLEYL